MNREQLAKTLLELEKLSGGHYELTEACEKAGLRVYEDLESGGEISAIYTDKPDDMYLGQIIGGDDAEIVLTDLSFLPKRTR